jgi:hypothetical protein
MNMLHCKDLAIGFVSLLALWAGTLIWVLVSTMKLTWFVEEEQRRKRIDARKIRRAHDTVQDNARQRTQPDGMSQARS